MLSGLKPGDTVVHNDGTIGKIACSTIGLSVCFTFTDANGNKIHGQTLGEPADEVAKYWRKATEDEVTAHKKR